MTCSRKRCLLHYISRHRAKDIVARLSTRATRRFGVVTFRPSTVRKSSVSFGGTAKWWTDGFISGSRVQMEISIARRLPVAVSQRAFSLFLSLHDWAIKKNSITFCVFSLNNSVYRSIVASNYITRPLLPPIISRSVLSSVLDSIDLLRGYYISWIYKFLNFRSRLIVAFATFEHLIAFRH